MFDALLRDHSHYATQRWSSYDQGWRSLLVREFDAHPAVEPVDLPAVGDQEIVLVVSGPARIASRQERGWQQARDFVGKIGLTAPGSPVTLHWTGTGHEPLRRLHVHVPGGLLARAAEELWNRELTELPGASSLATVDPTLENVLRGLRHAVRAGAPDLYADTAAQFLAVHTLIHHSGQRPTETSCRGEDRRIARAVRFMEESFDQPLTLTDIAAAAGLSRFHFARVFAADRGCSPMRHLSAVRLRAARAHLERGELTVTEIATRCGFATPSYFATVFTREVGLSPTAYRAAGRR